MRALRFDRLGSLDALRLADVRRPAPGVGEVLVEMRAAGVNPSDIKNVTGLFPETVPPRTPGRDFAGVVVEGPKHMLGHEVWGTGSELGFTNDGTHAELIRIAADGVRPKPKSLSFIEAAACGVAYVTAWDGLERAKLARGDLLVVIGAAGAVGGAAVELGRARGAEVLGAVRRPEQAERVRALDGTPLLLGEPAELAAAVHRHAPAGAQVIFDATGAWLDAAVGGLAVGGRLLAISAPSDGRASFSLRELYRRGGSILGVNSLLHDTRAAAIMLERIGDFFDRGFLHEPEVTQTRPLAEGVAVYREVERGRPGKTVLVP